MKKLLTFSLSLLAGVLFFANTTSASETISWEISQNLNIGKQIITSDQPFNAVRVEITKGNPEDFCIELEGFYGCNTLEKDSYENIFLTNSTDKLIVSAKGKGYLQFELVDSNPDENYWAKKDLKASNSTLSSAGIDVISRSEWGADESLGLIDPNNPPPPAKLTTVDDEYYETYKEELKIDRVVYKNGRGDEYIWPRQYPPKIRKIIVHHTASTKNLHDPEAAIRAIYHYHTVSRGWGDIGYNFVLDPQGNVYEGRAGGDMVVGGHAAPANVGSVGIAVLGDYHTEMEVSSTIKNKLAELISALCEKYGLDPLGISSFRGIDLPNIIGHRDVGRTACPGDKLYKLLPQIRMLVKKIDPNWVSSAEYDFELVESIPFFNIDPTTEKTIALNLRNIGTKIWGPGTILVPIETDNTVRATISASELLEPQVKPDEEGTFFTTIRSKNKSGLQMVNLALKINEKSTTEATFPIPVKIAPLDFDYEFISAEHPKSNLVAGEKTTGHVKVKNTSNFKWTREGEYEVHIAGVDPKGRVSSFFTPPTEESASDQIIIDTTKLATMREAEVNPGEIAHFDFTLTAPQEYGYFTEKFNLYAPSAGWFPDKGMQFNLFVRAPLARAKIVKTPKNTTFQLNPGERKKFQVTLKNIGELTWREGHVYFMSDDPFFPAVATYFDGPVKSGKEVDMTIEIQAPYEPGISLTSLRLTNEVPNGDFIGTPSIPIANQAKTYPVFRAEVVGDRHQSIKLKPWEVGEFTIKLKNTGSATWSKVGGPDGQGIMMLGTYAPKNRKSEFETNLWPKQTRGAIMQEDEVEPGEIATFIIPLKAPGRSGVYQEFFAPVIDWVGWIPSEPIRLWVQVEQDNSLPRPIVSTPDVQPTIPEIETPAEETSEGKVETETEAEEDPRIRILLSFDSPRYELTSSQEFYAKTLSGQKIATFRPGEIAVIDGGLFQDKSYTGLRFVTRYGGPLEIINWQHNPSWSDEVNDNLYRDTLEVRYYAGSWILINELSLEDYMLGLAEVPESDPLEKHKSVLVAARTYALWYINSEEKFPGAPYDGSDDPAVFQKYLGYNYEKRAPRHVEAVKSTTGEVVTYDDNVVKTPYFNSSDGRTRSAEEVWNWTHTPYLQSVSDPYCSAGVRRGHGVGLSGCGATGMAAKGKGYEEILKYFYTDIEIEKVY